MADNLHRRDFLGRGLAGLAGAGLVGAFVGAGLALAADSGSETASAIEEEDPSVFVFARFKYITRTDVFDQWDAHPDADGLFLNYLRRVTNLKVSERRFHERVVAIDDFARMYKQPFLFMTGEGDFAMSKSEASALGEFFKRGGFLYADDCVVGTTGDFFFRALLREIKKVMPGHEMRPVPPGHEIYHCHFDFPGKAPFRVGQPHPDMGLFYKKRLVAFLTAGDVHCQWWAGDLAEKTRSYQMGVNIVTYALSH